MQSSLRILLAFGCLVALCLNTGCVAIVAAHLRNKLPSAEAEEFKLTVNVIGAGGGYVEATNVSTKGGKLIAGTYVESITTGGGTYKLEAKGVDVSRVRNKKATP